MMEHKRTKHAVEENHSVNILQKSHADFRGGFNTLTIAKQQIVII